jgi:hypothetical protein
MIGEDPTASLAAASASFSAGDTTGADATAAAVDSLMAGAADAGTTRVIVGGLAGGVIAAGAGAAVVMRRRRQRDLAALAGPWTVDGDLPLAPNAAGEHTDETPPQQSNPAEPYATLGDPPPVEPAGTGSPERGRDEGDDR